MSPAHGRSPRFPQVATGVAAAVLLCPSLRAQGLEEIVVTARKRPESLGAIGLSITTFSARDIDRLRLTSADQIASQVANMDLNKAFGNANPVIVIRGVGLQDYNTNNTPAAGLYVDEVYLPSNAMGGFPLFDLERVEVLKGPQATLWGRNTTAGAVNFVTRQPSSSADLSVAASVGSYHASRVEFAGGGALTQEINGRLSGIYADRRGGLFQNRLSGEEPGEYGQWAVRGQLEAGISERTTALLSVHGTWEQGDSYPFTHVGIVGANCPISDSPPGSGARDESKCGNVFTGYSDPDGEPREGDWNVVPETDMEGRGASLRFDAALDSATFTSLTSYQTFDYRRGEDTDASASPLLRIDYYSDISSLSQEFRLRSNDMAAFQWTAGLHVSRDEHQESRVADLSGLFPGLLGPVHLQYEQSVGSLAPFGEVQWSASARTSVTFGLRYTHEQLAFEGGTAPVPGTFDPDFLAAGFPGLPANVDLDTNSDDLSGRVGLEFRHSANLLLWTSLSRGFKSGGVFGGFGLAPEAFTPYDPEHVIATEAGLKLLASDGRALLELSAFHYDYDDLQGQALVVASTGALPQLSNVGDARVLGGEAEITWHPLDALTLQAAVGLLDTEIRDDTLAIDSLQRPMTLRGNRLPHASHVNTQATATYERPVSDDVQLTLSANFSYRSPYFNDLQNQHHLEQESDTVLFGFWLALSGTRVPWEVSLWSRNLTDERFILHGNSSGVGNDLLMYGEPRTLGVQLAYRTR